MKTSLLTKEGKRDIAGKGKNIYTHTQSKKFTEHSSKRAVQCD